MFIKTTNQKPSILSKGGPNLSQLHHSSVWSFSVDGNFYRKGEFLSFYTKYIDNILIVLIMLVGSEIVKCYLSDTKHATWARTQSTQYEPASAVVISLKEFTICRVLSNVFFSILFSWNFHTAKIFLTENLCWIMNLKCRFFIFINYFSLHCLPYILGSPGTFSDKLKIFRQNFIK